MIYPSDDFRSNIEIRASNAERIVECPLSAHLAAQLPKLPTSFYAQEGIDAHEEAGRLLQHWLDDEPYETSNPAILSYVDYVIKRSSEISNCQIAIEQTLGSPSSLLNSSTPDCLLLGDDECEVIDFKYGENVFVSVNAWQLRIYAMLLLVHFPKYEEVKVTIVQPRHYSYEGAVSKVWAKTELREHWGILRNAAELAYSDNPPAKIGSHCQFCPALAVCPQHWKNLTSTINSVKELKEMKPEEITLEKLRHAWIEVENIIKFQPKLKEKLMTALKENGGEYENISIKKNSRASWVDDAPEKVALLASKYDIPLSAITKTELKTFTEVEKVFPKKGDNALEIKKELNLLREKKPIASSIKIKKV